MEKDLYCFQIKLICLAEVSKICQKMKNMMKSGEENSNKGTVLAGTQEEVEEENIDQEYEEEEEHQEEVEKQTVEEEKWANKDEQEDDIEDEM